MHINNEEQRHKMLNEPIGRLLFFKSYPTVIMQLITIIYSTADTYFVAKINTSASAAVGVVFSLMAVIQAFGFGIGMGANSLISRCLGAKKEKDANIYGSSAVFVGIIFGLLIMTAGLPRISGIMTLIGASKTVLPYAISYGKYILIAAPFMCLSFVLNNIIRAEGQSFFAMIGMTAGGILNVILDPVFIFKLGAGIKGAALATMISQITGAVIMSVFFITGKSIVKLSVKSVSLKFSVYYKIFKTGIPTIFRQGLASVSSAILDVQASVYGDAAVAAISIANRIYMLVRNVVLGIGQGYQPIAGYCYGAGNRERVKKVFRLACIAGTVICFVMSVIVLVFRRDIMSCFRDDAEVIRIGSDALLVCCFSIPFMAYSTYVNQTYQSLGFSVGATFLASCRQGIFFIPLALILPKIMGMFGIELLQPVADVLTFIISIPFQIRFFRRHLSDFENIKEQSSVR